MGKSVSGRWRLDGVTGGQTGGTVTVGPSLCAHSRGSLWAQVRFYTVDSVFKKRSQSPQSSRKSEKSLEILDGPMLLCLMEFELDSAV